MDIPEYTNEEEEKAEKITTKNLDYKTFADEHVLKEELHGFFESDILFRDKFQNETRLLKGELYNISNFKFFLYVLFNILFLGLPFLFAKWNFRFKLWALYVKCAFSEANYIKIVDSENNTQELTNLFEREIEIHGNFDNFKFFVYHFTKYYYNTQTKFFQQVEFKIENMTNREVFEKYQQGISEQLYIDKMGFLFDKNIIAIPEKSTFDILVDEILNPFNLFQIFSFVLWWYDDYGPYAVFIACVTLGSILFSLYEIKQNYKRLKEMLFFQRDIYVLRNGNFISMHSGDLVPGDIIQIPENSPVPCDLILLKGSCIVNEAVLTGESIPVPKNPLLENNHGFTAFGSQQCLLFSGSFCIKTNAHEKCLGLVYQIGFHTYKGQIAKELIYMKGNRFSFLEDSFKYIFVLFVIAVLGFLITLYPMLKYGYPISNIIVRGLELITIAIPPALPAAMETGIEYSIGRLKKQKISSIHPQKINIVGKINFIAFDKTGTLTEDGLDIYGYQITKNNTFEELKQEIPENQKYLNLIVMCFATCHNLIYLDGKLAGDPLDLKMFEFSKWIYREIDKDHREGNMISEMFCEEFKAGLSICRIFEFEPALQRMSVIFRDRLSGKLLLSIKGSPEQIFTLCKPETIPKNYHEINKIHAQKGYRVIAIGVRELDMTANQIIEVSRASAENNITFLGFLVCENKMKKETPNVIRQLNNAKINSLMVTGDNPLTAISVAKECKMISEGFDVYLLEKENPKKKFYQLKRISSESSEFDFIGMANDNLDEFFRAIDEINKRDKHCFAVTGDGFEFLHSLLGNKAYEYSVKEFLKRTIVFSRMKPHNKSQLILYLRGEDHFVLMTGDGANDCVAMKKADIGLSLSQEEASLASDFTSLDAQIGSLIVLIKEGRCALCTSINCFKFMTLYSMIQFLAVSILYLFDADMTTYQYIYADVLLVIPLAFTMNLSRPAETLSVKSPIYKLLSFPVLFSVIGQIFIVFIFQIISVAILINYKWYKSNSEINSLEAIEEGESPCYENNTLFLISCCQYIAAGVAFCEGEPFRTPFYKNYWFFSILGLLIALQLYVDLGPAKFILEILNMFGLLMEFKLVIVLLSSIGLVAVLIFEKKFVDSFVTKIEKDFE